MSATCKSCGAAIIWAETIGGKKMPVDAVSVADGNILLTRGAFTGALFAIVVSKDYKTTEPRYTSHFVTCPNAAQHRKGRG